MMSSQLPPHVTEALARSDWRIVITGAGGWLGMATLELLHSALGPDFGNRVRCFGARARALSMSDGASIAQRPLREIAALDPHPSLVLHLAFLTKDHAESMDEPEYRAANRALSRTVLDALDAIGTEAVFVASSGAARSADDPAAARAMRLYGALKREDEEEFAAWAERSGRTAVITRIFNLSGPHINKLQSYALASFILDALAGREVTVRAPHRVVRGYVAIREFMALVLSLMLRPNAGVVRFDTGGTPLELEEVARIVAEVVGDHGVVRPARTDDGADVYVGDDEGYGRLLEANGIPVVPFDRQVAETAAFLVAATAETKLGATGLRETG